MLIRPADAGTFAGTTKEYDLTFTAVSQIAADLLTSPGRGPQKVDELIEWMSRNEGAWRGGHRAVRLPGHNASAARIVRGLEGAD